MPRREFVSANTRLMAPPLVPEIVLYLADEALPLWSRTEEEMAKDGMPPPFWAFAWAGGQALARYVLDNPHIVANRRVLDLGAGGAISAIAAAKAGAAYVMASEVDEFALSAIALNAAANGVMVVTLDGDRLDASVEADVILVGDLFYERELAERTLAFLRRAADAGATVLVGDPSRTYLPQKALSRLHEYQVETPRSLEDSDVKLTTVWQLVGKQAQD
ncbi:MAG: methyltransferase [Acuticoccus sp.]